MNNRGDSTGSAQIYHHHLLRYWKHLLVVAFLIVMALGGFWISVPILGLALLALALAVAVGIYYHWSWHWLAFNYDGRLIHQYGLRGLKQKIIDLFGVVNPCQTLLGELFDIGSLYLGGVGPDSHIRYIANFSDFRTHLFNIRRAAQSQAQAATQVIIQLPPDTPSGDGQLPGLPGGPDDVIRSRRDSARPSGVRTRSRDGHSDNGH
jgi:hypothetical protein